MPKSDRQKLKMLYLMKILSEETDEDHPISMSALLERLSLEGISAERKSIYSDLECLQTFGLDIAFNSSRTSGGYFMASREFELPELKLLVDAVLASKFITENKSRVLISKIEKMASSQESLQLRRSLYNTGRIKNENESIYYCVDAVQTAIQGNKKIKFQYMKWSLDKKLIPKNNGEKYLVSPWALLWNDENYYLIGYDETAGILKHFRVDKMGEVELQEEGRTGKELYGTCDLNTYSARTFGMYRGREEIVTIQCKNNLAGVILDRFGKEVILQKADQDHFAVHVKVALSGQFYGWMTGIGAEAEIIAPKEVREEYSKYLSCILEKYHEKNDS